MLPYYRILGVARTANPDEIKKAYRRLARKFHPDHNGGHALAEERFRLVAEAYEVLTDSESRSAYDRYGSQGLVRGRNRPGVVGGVERFVANLESIVESRLKATRKRGDDRRRIVTVTLDDICQASSVTIDVERVEQCRACSGSRAAPGTQNERCHVCEGDGRLKRGTLLKAADLCPFCQGVGVIAVTPCSECHGAGELKVQRSHEVEIPRGVESGRRLVLRGHGAPGENGGASGDLFLEIKVEKHALLTREGVDVHCTVPVSLTEAVMGGQVDVPVPGGPPIAIKVPRGTTSGQTLRLQKRGLPHAGGERGDLWVRLEIETPKLNKAGLAALAALDEHSKHPRRAAYDKVTKTPAEK